MGYVLEKFSVRA